MFPLRNRRRQLSRMKDRHKWLRHPRSWLRRSCRQLPLSHLTKVETHSSSSSGSRQRQMFRRLRHPMEDRALHRQMVWSFRRKALVMDFGEGFHRFHRILSQVHEVVCQDLQPDHNFRLHRIQLKALVQTTPRTIVTLPKWVAK